MILIFEVAFYSDNHHFKKQKILEFVSKKLYNFYIFWIFKLYNFFILLKEWLSKIIDWDTLLSVYAYRFKTEVLKHRGPLRPILYEQPHNYDWPIRSCSADQYDVGKKGCKQTN